MRLERRLVAPPGVDEEQARIAQGLEGPKIETAGLRARGDRHFGKRGFGAGLFVTTDVEASDEIEFHPPYLASEPRRSKGLTSALVSG